MKIQLYTLILKNIYIIILHLDYSHVSRDKSLNSKRGRFKNLQKNTKTFERSIDRFSYRSSNNSYRSKRDQ